MWRIMYDSAPSNIIQNDKSFKKKRAYRKGLKKKELERFILCIQSVWLKWSTRHVIRSSCLFVAARWCYVPAFFARLTLSASSSSHLLKHIHLKLFASHSSYSFFCARGSNAESFHSFFPSYRKHNRNRNVR